jgi:sugar/nucleoside kinase (ribokinase family)
MEYDFDVIVLGDYCLDLIFTGLPAFPKLGTEVEATELAMETGGACNTSLALHRLGVKTGWAVEFGTDDFSRFLLTKLREEKFPETLFAFTPGNMRKITVSLSYPDDRAFIAYYDKGKMIETAIKGLMTKRARIIVIPALLYGPAMAAGSALTKIKGTQLFMDGNCSEAVTIDNKEVRKAIQSMRFYSPNCREAKTISKQANPEKAVRELGKICQTVIVKDGQNGCWCSDNGNIYHEPGYPVKVVDTTGAGDCFNAGFLCAWLDGKDIQTCLRWGNIAGALSTQKAGGNGYKLSVQEISEKAKEVSK